MEKTPSLSVAPFFESTLIVSRKRQHVRERVFVARPSFFDVFTFPLRVGSAETALVKPRSAVITPTMAKTYFGDANPVASAKRSR
mgnify:CR=1 FL=1